MKAQYKLYLLFSLFLVVALGNYYLSYDSESFRDEGILSLFLVLLGLFYFFFLRKYVLLYSKTLKIKDQIVQAELVRQEEGKDDLEFLNEAVVSVAESVNNARAFIDDLKSGKLHNEVEIHEGDSLMQSLNELKNQMMDLERDEKERNWASRGMSQFVDILRGNNLGIGNFYDSIISNIVKYLDANQGSLFLVLEKNGKKYLSMEACYAYERKKFINKEVLPGEGLVGQIYLEKRSTYLKEIPEDYVSITSGLGKASPRNLVIVPFILNEEVECIIEIASFKEIKPYQIEFLEKLGESVASAISSFRVNESTKKLLEETQTQTEALRAQEEEMRQNMEELQATQESLERESLEKEKVQKEIQKTMDFMQGVINALPDPVFVKDRKHNMVLVNEAWCSLFNLKVENVIGKNDHDFFKKEEADQFFAAEEKIFVERTEYSQEEQATKDGNTVYTMTKKRIIEDDDGTLFLVGMNSDITESKRLAEDLKKEKYLMDALMHNTTDLIYFKDIESKFIRVSETMLKRFKATKQQDIVGKSDFDYYSEEHALPAYNGEQEIIKTGTPILNIVEKETYEDGSFTYVSTTKVPLNDLDGKTIGTFGISRDVTEAKLVELEMERREKLMASLFNYSDEVLSIVDKKQVVNFVSSNSSKILGLDHTELINQELQSFIHKEDIAKIEKAIKNVRNNREAVVVIQFRHITLDGQYINVEASIYNAMEDADIQGYVLKTKAVEAKVLA